MRDRLNSSLLEKNESPISDLVERRNQAASDWMHRGLDLLNGPAPDQWKEAISCFDEAIVLRQLLPLEHYHWFRYALSAGWINRGDALSRLTVDPVEAIRSYDEALSLLQSLPLSENPLYVRRLAITWLNRGLALQPSASSPETRTAPEAPNLERHHSEGTSDKSHRRPDLYSDALTPPPGRMNNLQCFREALSVLENPVAEAVTDRLLLRAGAWVNLSLALVTEGDRAVEEAQGAAQQAVALAREVETTEITAAEVGLKGRHILLRLAVIELEQTGQIRNLGECTDAADETIELVRHWNQKGYTRFQTLFREIVRFGCRIYASQQPHFLAEFLEECLNPGIGDLMISDRESMAAAQAAIWSAVNQLPKNGFGTPGASQFERFLSQVQKLRIIKSRLQQE